jgi:hypothetical protein
LVLARIYSISVSKINFLRARPTAYPNQLYSSRQTIDQDVVDPRSLQVLHEENHLTEMQTFGNTEQRQNEKSPKG